MRSLDTCLFRMARPRLYTQEQWSVVALSVVCIAAGLWGVYESVYGEMPAYPLDFVEVALVLAVGLMLWFAFSHYPVASGPKA